MSLELGDTLPDFELNDQNGKAFISKEEIGKSPLIIYFYPKNFTPGCTREACSFRDNFEDFTDLGARVIGISGDDEKSHQKFATRYKLPFTLLADSNNKVRRKFGVKPNLLGILPGRETFVFSTEGTLTFKFKAMGADPHIQKALRHLRKQHE